MPTLNGKLLDENCPDCITRGKQSRLVEVTQDWNMEEEGNNSVVAKQCPCGYKEVVIDEMPLLHEPTREEFLALKGEHVEGYRISDSFRWVSGYFANSVSQI